MAVEEKYFHTTMENYSMQASVKVIGKDLIISITGGETPHIGTITTFTQESELETIRFPSHSGRFHKDDVLAKKLLY